ncbi:MAG TPA: hypothetical protein VN426_03860 [Syntrophomonadaceae bacterium]|nr:hypothetical protein [Syntrophomonadaceae bacterium]
MLICLEVSAGLLLILYSIYFFKILKGDPLDFEIELMKSLAEWMINRGPASRWQLWMLYFLSILLEAGYFFLVFSLMNNMFIRMFSMFFAGFEVFHLFLVGANLNRFFRGKIPLKHIFSWPVERCSAVLFFTNTMLVLVNVFFYPL